MTHTELKIFGEPRALGVISVLTLLVAFLIPNTALSQTYGIKDAEGNFVPKVTINVGAKAVTIKKTDPKEKFSSLSLKLNPNLVKNVANLNIEWLDATGKAPGKPLPFQGPPKYDPKTGVFQDSMGPSAGLRILDKKGGLFAGKNAADLFVIKIDNQGLVSAESAMEKDRTVQLGTGRDVSINVAKSAVVFNEGNLKKGEMLDVDNRSGVDQVLGVELPEKGLLFSQIVKKLEQKPFPRESWERFTLPPDAGIFIVLIPEPDPSALAQLDGKDIVIKVYQGNRIRETRKIPVKVASDLLQPGTDLSGRYTGEEEEGQATAKPMSSASRTAALKGDTGPRPQQAAASVETRRRSDQGNGAWIWLLQIFNLALLVALGSYGIFFMLPRIQVLEDRLAKNEMFLHGSREAIRDELEQIKKEILQQCLQDTSGE